MSELVKSKEINCPWCHNSLDIIRSGKSGMHYANCGSCNAHFRNIPLVLLGIKDNGGTSHNSVDHDPPSKNIKEPHWRYF